ncbi:uracil-DNA glycosylase [Thiomicrorhabdus chilensis]|uniref:uracil-DNA glycosylase n=1 Tax=Thiomicrorhabdus chilensis TaxID=63656 RepID=UPI00040116F1|nr:uracil-DNA glycosylase [Thiomicrorhabdus chilensis]
MPQNLIKLPCGWENVLAGEYQKPYLQTLQSFLQKEIAAGKQILPKQEEWLNALESTPFENVRVIIIGQDPYPTPGHSHGLCFSVKPDVKPLPKSLLNINKELLSDLNIDNNHIGYLQPWAKQGVLLLNAVLTVEASNSNSHQNKGWEQFTDAVIQQINDRLSHCVFILWGGYAQKKGRFIDRTKHLVLESAHPSPLSAYRGFFGSHPFSQTNNYLISHGKSPINWQL